MSFNKFVIPLKKPSWGKSPGLWMFSSLYLIFNPLRARGVDFDPNMHKCDIIWCYMCNARYFVTKIMPIQCSRHLLSHKKYFDKKYRPIVLTISNQNMKCMLSTVKCHKSQKNTINTYGFGKWRPQRNDRP